MSRFYFDVREGEVFTEDMDGTELVGRHVIFAEARRLLLDIARDTASKIDPFTIEISVREAQGRPMHWHSLLMEGRWPDDLKGEPSRVVSL